MTTSQGEENVFHYKIRQPRGSTPGPWSVVGDPWSRSRDVVVGDNGGRGPEGDPHVSPYIASTDQLGGCFDCEEGNHPESVHVADARLLAIAPEMYDLVARKLRTIASIADRDGHDMDGWMSQDGQWARDAARVLAEALPQKLRVYRGAYVYPRSLPVRAIIALILEEEAA